MDKLTEWFEQISRTESTKLLSIYDLYSPIDSALVNYRFKVLKDIISSKRKPGARLSASAWKGNKSRMTGLCFEWLIKGFIHRSQLLGYHQRVLTSSNEIDFLINVKPESRLIPFINTLQPTHLLGEAKCYSSEKLSVKWIDSLVGVMASNSTNLAILFVYKKGKIKTDIKYKLKVLEASEKKVIIPVGLTQIERALNGEHLLQLINEQYIGMVTTSQDLTL